MFTSCRNRKDRCPLVELLAGQRRVELALDVGVTEGDLASQATPDSQAVAADAVACFGDHGLAGGLVLQLIVLADEVVARGTLEETPALLRHSAVALYAHCARDRAPAGMPASTWHLIV